MFIRNEVGDNLIITADYAHIRNIYETCIYEITESGLLWLSGRYRIGTDKATMLHNSTVARLQGTSQIHKCRCGKVARQFSRIMNDWVCAECWDLNVGERV
jgi:hypothetical protein